MSELYPFFRLMTRPAFAVGWLWALWLVCGVPALSLTDGPVSVFVATSTDQVSAEAWRALWRLALLFPAAAGVVVAVTTGEAMNAPWSWTLPSLRPRIVKGLALVAAAVSLPAALLLSRMDAESVAFAAFALGAFAFAAANLMLRRMMIRIDAWVALALLATGVWQADRVAALAMGHPWFVTVMGLEGAALWIYLGHSARSVREGIAHWSPRHWWQRTRRRATRRSPVWRRPLAQGRILDWVLAGEYETWSSRSRFAWPLTVVMMFAVYGILMGSGMGSDPEFNAYFLGWHVMIVAPMCMWMPAPFIAKARLYPLSRRRRAIVVWWASLAATIGVGVVAVVWLPFLAGLLMVLPWTRIEAISVADLLRYVPVALIWLPLFQWVATRYRNHDWMACRSSRTESGRGAATFAWDVGAMVLYVTATFWTQSLVDPERGILSTAEEAVALGAMFTGVQLVYWLTLRRYFRTGDLVQGEPRS